MLLTVSLVALLCRTIETQCPVCATSASRAFETAQWVAIDESWSIIATIVDIA
jgi:hypothetical protein